MIHPDHEAVVEQLAGGVSCQVWKITCGETRLVLKQALAKLNVQAEWYSDVNRIVREVQAMKFLTQLLPENSLPQIVHEDPNEHLYVMTCAPEGAKTWKSVLMEGRFSVEVARQAGELLRMMHFNSRTAPLEQIKVFQDLSYFEQLRVDPFYVYLKRLYPQLQSEIDDLIWELTENSSCIVHGDFSPKNMLVDDNDRMILLDYEVAHWGNPVFDVAFLLTHLLLKGWGLKRERESYALIQAFMNEYQLETRHLLPHIGLLLLARLDGKSTVDYIKDELIDIIRSTAIAWIQSTSVENPLPVIEKALKGEPERE
nr:aminoglycoside phosphotransferase family protein [Paenibacillus mangrovi]